MLLGVGGRALIQVQFASARVVGHDDQLRPPPMFTSCFLPTPGRSLSVTSIRRDCVRLRISLCARTSVIGSPAPDRRDPKVLVGSCLRSGKPTFAETTQLVLALGATNATRHTPAHGRDTSRATPFETTLAACASAACNRRDGAAYDHEPRRELRDELVAIDADRVFALPMTVAHDHSQSQTCRRHSTKSTLKRTTVNRRSQPATDRSDP